MSLTNAFYTDQTIQDRYLKQNIEQSTAGLNHFIRPFGPQMSNSHGNQKSLPQYRWPWFFFRNFLST
jgi:hypothetical protein